MLVYVTDERVLYNWYWAEPHTDKSYLPFDFEDRFRDEVL